MALLGKRTNSNRIQANPERHYHSGRAHYNQYEGKFNSQDELDYEPDMAGDVSNFEGLGMQIGLTD